MAAATSSASSTLKEYLKRYQSPGAGDEQDKKKKKKKKPKPNPMAGGVLLVDEDPVWQKPIQLEEQEESDPSGDEKPLVEEDVEVKRMKRLEAIRALKPYNSISEDGSGWVSISDTSKQLSSSDLSPPRRRTRLDTPSPCPADRNLSPPLQGHRRHDTLSPGCEREPGEWDLSRPRKHRRRHESLSPGRSRKTSNIKDPQLPPRPRSHRRSDTLSPEPDARGDLSPPRRQARDDLSPPGQGRQSVESAKLPESSAADLSPPRKVRRRSPGDLSPLSRARHHSLDAPQKHGSPAPDLSPPRRSRKGLSGDLPPRPHQSQETRKARESPADDDISPPSRSWKGSSGDLSPPRRGRSPEALRMKESSAADLSPPRKRRKEEAPKTGLLSAKELREETVRKRKEELAMFESIDPALLGKGAQPVFRKEGKRISKEELLKEQEEEKPKEKKLEWGKGLAQKREAESKAQELELEKDKPFARTRDDPELDKMLKERIRWGDPMAHLVKRKHSEDLLEDLGDDEKMKESGFIVPQTIPSHSWIKRGLEGHPNRYGIRPGRHWDGVDRSNGYEKELFKRQNEKRATETEAYLWSVSDM